MILARSAVLCRAVIFAGLLAAGCGGGERVDLITRLPEAAKHPSADSYIVAEHALAGERMPAVAVKAAPETRLVWRVHVPRRAQLKLAFGLEPQAWSAEGDGVRFRVTAGSGAAARLLLEQHVNPFANDGDRKWFPVVVDLSAFADQDVDLTFATFASPEGAASDERNDLALWGRPEILAR